MNNSDLYILTFIVTGLWDVVLSVMTENWERLPKIIKTIMPFIEYLKPYFKQHTVLAAALIAAFVGATTEALSYLKGVPYNALIPAEIIALVGVPILYTCLPFTFEP